MSQSFNPENLKREAEIIFGKIQDLNWHQRLVSVYRPLYAPFDEMFRWLPAHAKVVDIGCGTGSFLMLAQSFVGLDRGIGIDTNAHAIDLATRANPFSMIKFKVGQEPQMQDLAEANVVSLIDVLHHVAKNEKILLLEKLAVHVGAGTRIFIKDLDPKQKWKALANRVTDFLRQAQKLNTSL